MKASVDAMIQTIVCTRPTGMPSIAARSDRSAAARTAVPVCVRVRNRVSAIRHAGTVTNVTMSFELKMVPPKDQLMVNGGLSR